LEQQTANSAIGVAYFYFKYSLASSMLSVTIALLEQFYQQSPSFAEEVVQLQENADSGSVHLGDVLPVLLAIMRRFGRCFVVLDALDECAPEHRTDLFTLLNSLSQSKCHLLATSRPQPRPFFEDYVTIEVVAADEDIKGMIDKMLPKNSPLSPFILENKSRIYHHIIKQCHGM
jgi:hypothetical protein